ncbi:hypothetical protein [Sulfurimonas sp.]
MGNRALEIYINAKNSLRAAEEEFFTKEMKAAFFMMFAIGVFFLVPDTVMAANPLETMKNVYITQAQDNAFPVIILWTLVLGIVISFAMGKFMPFILAVIASVVIAITPDVAPNFTNANLNP